MLAVTMATDVPFALADLSGTVPHGAPRCRDVGALVLRSGSQERVPLSMLLDSREVLRLASMSERRDLPEAVALVVSHLAASGGHTEQSLARMSTEIARFVMRLEWLGLEHLDDVAPTDVSGFLDEPVANGDGLTYRPAEPGTVHVRRSAVRLLYRTARQLGITSLADPTMDLPLPRRKPRSARPLTDDEEVRCRDASHVSLHLTRLPAAWALGQATATCSEIAEAKGEHVELDRSRVWLFGGQRRDARWGNLTAWGVERLARRIDLVGDPALPLIYGAQRNDKSGTATCGGILNEVIAAAGLGEDPLLKPQSLLAWAGRKVFEESGDIILVATTLGVRSLDAAARIIGEDWR